MYSKQFNEDHRLNVMLAMKLQSSEKIQNGNMVWGYLPERGETLAKPTLPNDFVSQGIASLNGWGVFDQLYSGRWRRTDLTDNFMSFFATTAYSLKDRYVFNFSVRNDMSNRFGQNIRKRVDPTYSFGLSWRATDEKWMELLAGYINNFNVRVTYGIQGNALTNIGPDLVLNRGFLDSSYGQFKSTISRLPNPNLSWERTRSWDIGFDLNLFRMLDFTVDYYWRKSNAIISQSLPYEYGMSSMQMNGGMLENSGVEFTAAFTPVRTKDFALSISLNASKNWNELAKTDDYVPTASDFLNGSTSRVLKDGYPLGGFWSYSFAGLNPEDGQPTFNYLDVEETNPNVDPTSYLVYSGKTEPDFTGGVQLSARYKNLSLSSNFSLLLGGKKRLPSPFSGLGLGTSRVTMPDATSNLSNDLMERWQNPGDEEKTIIPAFISGNITLPTGSTDNFIEVWEMSDAMVADASFFRCNSLSLSYRLGNERCKQWGIKSLSLNTSVSNLFVIASKRFDGWDPELKDSVHPKNLSFGVNIGF
jgi:hypothetical protein